MTRQDQIQALREICSVVVDTIQKSGPMGMPGGHLYAILLPFGITLDQFDVLMNTLVEAKKITRVGQCYHGVSP